jgi:hypothetical protein
MGKKKQRGKEYRVTLNPKEEASLVEAFEQVKRSIGAKNAGGVFRYFLANASSFLSPHASVPPPMSAQEMDSEEEPL